LTRDDENERRDEQESGEPDPAAEQPATPESEPEAAAAEGEAEATPEAAAEPEPEAGSEPAAADAAEPEAADAAAPEPEAAPEPPADEAEGGEEAAALQGDEATEPEPEKPEKPAGPGKPDKEKEKDVVPGANLEPIAITEERELTAEERARLEAEEEERARREAAATEDDDEELPRRAAVSVPTDASIRATGKRKSSVARVILRAGGGTIEINGRTLDDYFARPHHQSVARQPLVTAGYDGNVDVTVRVHGGGISGQAGAVRHGIARALVELDPQLRDDLKRRGMLTRDARAKERRKAGLKKARKRPQFSKR
jgi:small subunit ribosomal protein S9